MSRDDIVLTILETPREKELNALRQIAKDRTYWEYERVRRQKKQYLVWDFLRQVKARLPVPTGGALFISGSLRVPGAVPEDLQIWPVPEGTPSF